MTGDNKAGACRGGEAGRALLLAGGIMLAGAAASSAQPSFDCRKAATPDELAICANPELGDLDRLIAGAYSQMRTQLGKDYANRIHLPYLHARQACGGNAFCIMQRQASEIPAFEALGIATNPPRWLDVHAPSYSQLKTMVNVGDCTATTIDDISYRLCSPDANNVCVPAEGSGTSVALANGMYLVSYDSVPAAFQSQSGDPVIACLVEKPRDCPPGDDRGYVWSVTNMRTGGTWELPDSQHMCGGA
jgi:uncharacterized protein